LHKVFTIFIGGRGRRVEVVAVVVFTGSRGDVVEGTSRTDGPMPRRMREAVERRRMGVGWSIQVVVVVVVVVE
jgi:hypothetical protein